MKNTEEKPLRKRIPKIINGKTIFVLEPRDKEEDRKARSASSKKSKLGTRKARAENELLKKALFDLKRGECFCDVDKLPLMLGRHSKACIAATNLLKDY